MPVEWNGRQYEQINKHTGMGEGLIHTPAGSRNVNKARVDPFNSGPEINQAQIQQDAAVRRSEAEAARNRPTQSVMAGGSVPANASPFSGGTTGGDMVGPGGAGTNGRNVLSVPTLPPPQPSYQQQWAHQKSLIDGERAYNDRLRGEGIAGLKSQIDQYSQPVGMPSMDGDDGRAAALEFGRAKDRIGRQRLAAVRSFQDVNAGRGYMGSSMESAGTGAILGQGLDELGDVTLHQAQDRVNRQRQLFDVQSQRQNAARQSAIQQLTQLYSSLGLG